MCFDLVTGGWKRTHSRTHTHTHKHKHTRKVRRPRDVAFFGDTDFYIYISTAFKVTLNAPREVKLIYSEQTRLCNIDHNNVNKPASPTELLF